MAHLWFRCDDGWHAQQLGGRCATGLLLSAASHPSEDAPPALVRRADIGGDQWVIVACRAAHAVLNGLELSLGIAVLCDRDEIRVDGGPPVYFSTERRPAVDIYRGGDGEARCPRCTQSIEVGSLAVCCPGCGLWHHQAEPLNCWTYDATCAVCPQPTPLEVSFHWTPEEL